MRALRGSRAKASSRRDAVADTAKGLGGQLEAFYFAFGDHDAVVIVELPDNEAAAATALAVNAAGRGDRQDDRSAYSQQVDDAAKRSVDYRRPGT